MILVDGMAKTHRLLKAKWRNSNDGEDFQDLDGAVLCELGLWTEGDEIVCRLLGYEGRPEVSLYAREAIKLSRQDQCFVCKNTEGPLFKVRNMRQDVV